MTVIVPEAYICISSVLKMWSLRELRGQMLRQRM